MDLFILIALLILTFIGLPIGVIILLYWLPKKFGYKKLGKYLASIAGLFFGLLMIYILFEDSFFFKKDAKKLLKEQNIYLEDDFEIMENKSMTAPGDYYHTFTLKISQRDKDLIIEQIKNDKSFKGIKDDKADISRIADRYFGEKIIQNYEDETQFVREYFKPSGKKNYSPTYRKIEINKADNKLIFEDIDD